MGASLANRQAVAVWMDWRHFCDYSVNISRENHLEDKPGKGRDRCDILKLSKFKQSPEAFLEKGISNLLGYLLALMHDVQMPLCVHSPAVMVMRLLGIRVCQISFDGPKQTEGADWVPAAWVLLPKRSRFKASLGHFFIPSPWISHLIFCPGVLGSKIGAITYFNTVGLRIKPKAQRWWVGPDNYISSWYP
jgi:hypothetical protein